MTRFPVTDCLSDSLQNTEHNSQYFRLVRIQMHWWEHFTFFKHSSTSTETLQQHSGAQGNSEQPQTISPTTSRMPHPQNNCSMLFSKRIVQSPSLSEESSPLKLVHQRQKSVVKNSPLASLASTSSYFVLQTHKKQIIQSKQSRLTKLKRDNSGLKWSSRIPVSSRTPEFSWNLYKQLHTSNSKYWTGLQILVRNTGSHILWLAERSIKCLLPNLSR